MERFGSCLDCSLDDIDIHERCVSVWRLISYIVLTPHCERPRAKIVTKLVETHRAGMHPVDFTPRNILVKDGDYRIVDLRDAISHRCTWEYDFIKHAGVVDRDEEDESPRRPLTAVRCL